MLYFSFCFRVRTKFVLDLASLIIFNTILSERQFVTAYRSSCFVLVGFTQSWHFDILFQQIVHKGNWKDLLFSRFACITVCEPFDPKSSRSVEIPIWVEFTTRPLKHRRYLAELNQYHAEFKQCFAELKKTQTYKKSTQISH